MVAYLIRYTPDAMEHLERLTARQQAIVLEQVLARLSHEPTVESRNRKRMRPNPVAPWELRIGRLRVYYDVETGLSPQVVVLAVGVKRRAIVIIGRGEYRL